jgi:CDP-diacylglycerol--glycerol-3-phosphate 3-phosphatidyltransferase
VQHLLPSRANLNASYFQNRQDRYLYFSNQPRLVEYLAAFMATFSKISYLLTPSSSLAAKPAPNGEGGTYQLTWTNRTLCHGQIELEARNSIRALQDRFSEPLSYADVPPECDTFVYPLIQSGVLGVREEEMILADVLDCLLERGVNKYAIDLTSGYFALYEPYQLRALKDGLDWRILAASPKAR